jgi:hypothetical protein
MIIERHISEKVGVLPVPMEFFEILHNISMFLINDDAGDVGHFRYHERDYHYYHGKQSPSHPGVMHHWQIGVCGLLISQLGSLLNLGMGVYEDYKKAEKGDVSDIDQDILDLVDSDNVISMEDYKEEVSAIPTEDYITKHLSPLEPPRLPSLPGLTISR